MNFVPLPLVYCNFIVKKTIILLFILIFLYSCTKKEELIIYGNVPPPDNTVSNVLRENYIHKTYISLLGRKPTETEYLSARQKLASYELKISDREAFVDEVLAKPEYYRRMYDLARAEYLNNSDSLEMQTFIDVFNQFLSDTSYQALWPAIQQERDKLINLKNAPVDFANGVIDIKGVYKRIVNNYIYDQINMGTENFVVSMFQHFMYRYPTLQELEDGKKMVDGFYSYLFYQEGNTKDDFIRIFFDSDAFYEGRVRDLYKRYLFREATVLELKQGANLYKSTNNYKALQKTILISDEFVGLK